MLEIERRFLINEIPGEVKPGKGNHIAQGYLAAGPEREVRLRRYGKKCFLTAKRGAGTVREELEIPLQTKQFEELWPGTAGLRIEKTRFSLPVEEGTIEVDIFEGPLQGLIIAEIEFSDRKRAEAFRPPWWFGPEVSEDRRFRNSSLVSIASEEGKAFLKQVISPPMPAVGAVPFLMMNEQRHYVLITTRSTGRWIFPKGGLEPKKSDREMALIEAEEEAGVTGAIAGEAVPTWYWKEYQRYRITYFPMGVENLMMKWGEAKQRQRRVCTYEEARELLSDPALLRCLDQVEEQQRGKKG